MHRNLRRLPLSALIVILLSESCHKQVPSNPPTTQVPKKAARPPDTIHEQRENEPTVRPPEPPRPTQDAHRTPKPPEAAPVEPSSAPVAAAVNGTISDSSGAAVPNAQVNLTNQKTGDTRSTKTNSSGSYIFLGVAPGNYTVTASLAGFRTMTTQVTVAANQAVTFDFTFTDGSMGGSAISAGPRPSRLRKTPANTVPDSVPPPPVPITDASRPRKIVLPPGAPANSAAYKFESPALQQGQPARFRLLVDPKPILAASAGDYSRKRVAGTTDGIALAIAPLLEAQLTSEQPDLKLASEDQARKEIDPDRATEWFWDATPANPGKASVRLDLNKIVNGELLPLDGFPIHIDLQVNPSQPATRQPQPAIRTSAPLWWLALIPLAAAGVWFLLRKRKPPAAVPSSAAAAPQRTILLKDDSYVFVVDVLTIYHSPDQAALQAFCRQIADDRYRFNIGVAGFAMGSAHWQQWFTSSLASCDAILVVLSADSLGEKWLNWQLDKALGAQTEREIPIYVAALDEQVLKVARTVQLLEGIACYPPTPQGQADLKASLRSSELAAARNIRCFISYSHTHRDFAKRICADLNHAGIRTWMDVEGIPGGVAWKQAIASAINSSTHVLFVLTDESVKSDQVSSEIDWAQQKKKTIIPVMENEVELPFGLLGTQYISFTQAYDAGLRRLLQDLTRSANAGKAVGA